MGFLRRLLLLVPASFVDSKRIFSFPFLPEEEMIVNPQALGSSPSPCCSKSIRSLLLVTEARDSIERRRVNYLLGTALVESDFSWVARFWKRVPTISSFIRRASPPAFPRSSSPPSMVFLHAAISFSFLFLFGVAAFSLESDPFFASA